MWHTSAAGPWRCIRPTNTLDQGFQTLPPTPNHLIYHLIKFRLERLSEQYRYLFSGSRSRTQLYLQKLNYVSIYRVTAHTLHATTSSSVVEVRPSPLTTPPTSAIPDNP